MSYINKIKDYLYSKQAIDIVPNNKPSMLASPYNPYVVTLPTVGGGGGSVGTTGSFNTALGYTSSGSINIPPPPTFTISQDPDGTWHINVNTKNKKFIRGVLQTLLNDCDDLDLEGSLEVTKKLNAI